MLTSGDVVRADLGLPAGREAGFARPVVVVTAQGVLDQGPNVVHVVPLTSRLRPRRVEVELDPDAANGLDAASAAQCQHVRAVAVERLGPVIGNVGPADVARIREVVGLLLGL
jgi:mRNA interferase MazF